jgi:hypothetical protein
MNAFTHPTGPGACAGLAASGAQPGHAELAAGDLLDDPPGGRRGGHLAEQLRLVAQHAKVAQAVTAVSQQHRQIAQHLARIEAAGGLASTRPSRQRAGQAQPISQLGQQRRASVPRDPVAVAGDVEPWTQLGSLHPQGALLAGE